MIHLSANDLEALQQLGRVTIWQPAASHFSVGELVPTSAGPLRVESVSPVATYTTQFRRVTLERGAA
jgi:hypothetical protein